MKQHLSSSLLGIVLSACSTQQQVTTPVSAPPIQKAAVPSVPPMKPEISASEEKYVWSLDEAADAQRSQALIHAISQSIFRTVAACFTLLTVATERLQNSQEVGPIPEYCFDVQNIPNMIFGIVARQLQEDGAPFTVLENIRDGVLAEIQKGASIRLPVQP